MLAIAASVLAIPVPEALLPDVAMVAQSNVSTLIQGTGCATAQSRYDQAQAAADAASARAAVAATAGNYAAQAANTAAARMEKAAADAEKLTVAAEAAAAAANTADTNSAWTALAAAEQAAAMAHDLAANSEANAALTETSSTAANDAAAAAEEKSMAAQAIATSLFAGLKTICVPAPSPPPPSPPAAQYASTFSAATSAITNYAVNSGGWTTFNTYPRMTADVNGDGKADVIGFGSSQTYVSLSTGSGSFGAPTAWIANYATGAGGWSSYDTYPRAVADVDGDGKADVVGFGAAGVYVSLSTGTSFGTPQLWIANYATGAGGWTTADKYPRMVADVDGDGKADIIGFGADHTFVSLSTGTGFGTPTSWVKHYTVNQGGWSSYNTYPRTVADVNGDGKADFIGFGAAGIYLALSTGTSFAPASLAIANYATGAGGWSSQDVYPRMAKDVNGDGKADIIGFGADYTFVSLSTGTGFGTPTSWVKHFTVNQGGWSSYNSYPRTIGDITGNGKGDLVAFGASYTYTARAV